MGSVPPRADVLRNDYPTTDGKPMAETDWHRNLMVALIETLKVFYAAKKRVYVSGNLLVFYEPGNKRKHVSPDVFVVKGVRKHDRPNYLVWQEGKAPNLVIELTSSTTRKEDLNSKYKLYQNVLKVKEYFLFDPREDYLDPPQQGYRLRKGVYQPIRAVRGRLPSQVLGLHLERSGEELRLFDPATGQWLPTPAEQKGLERQARQQAEAKCERERQARQQAETARQQSEAARQLERQARQVAEAEIERLSRELEDLRRRASEEEQK
jgi:Uma2 family endonuclease